MKPFWTDAGDASERRFLAEHGTVGRFAGDEMVIDAGNGALLPAWPPVVNLPGLMVPLAAEVEPAGGRVAPRGGLARAGRVHDGGGAVIIWGEGHGW